MKNKKGILMEEVLRLIIAVICIVLLIYLSVSLYGIMIGKHEVEQASATLGDISGKLEVEGTYNYLITSPKNWVLVSYPNENRTCICPAENDEVTQKSRCLTAGTCKSLKYPVYSPESCGSVINCISLEKLPISITLIKIPAFGRIELAK